MTAIRRRHFRLPVFSRLTLAWFGVLGVVTCVGAGAAMTLLSGKGPGRVSLPIDQLEIMARAETDRLREDARLNDPNRGVRLGAPVLRDGGAAGGPAIETIEGAPGEDILLYPDEYASMEPAEEDRSGDIIITIPGQKASGATAASLTSLRGPAAAITDPDPALLRKTTFGKAPRIGPDGRKAMNVYAQAYQARDDAPRIALIVGGLGLNTSLTERAIDDLPPEVSLAFAPYAKNLAFWADKARRAGHEVLIELPMEGYGATPEALGAAGLLTSRTPEDNLQRLDWLMSRFEGYFAATNYMGAKFSTEPGAISPVLEKLRASGVAYYDDTGAAPIANNRAGTAVAMVNRVIPPAPDDSQRGLVRRELQTLEEMAERDGAALGKTYAYAATIDEIIEWAGMLEAKGLAAAPASSILPVRSRTR